MTFALVVLAYLLAVGTVALAWGAIFHAQEW